MNEPQYILERWPHGWLLKAPQFSGGVPIDCLNEILPAMPKNSVVDGSISAALGAVFAIGTEKECKAWRAEIEEQLEKDVKDPYRRWLLGTDTGVSSITMFSEMIDKADLRLEALSRIRDPDIPHDSSDFGRCYRLLQKFPEFGKRWAKLVEKHPAWRLYADNWSTLEGHWVAKEYVAVNAMLDRIRDTNERKST